MSSDRTAHDNGFTLLEVVVALAIDLFADAKAQFRSVAEPWVDTGSGTGRLMLAVLGGLADVERDLIRPAPPRENSRQGPRKADGPLSFPAPAQQKEATRRRAQGATLKKIGGLRPTGCFSDDKELFIS